MPDWSLTKLFSSLHKDVEQRLGIARDALDHPVAKGDGAEAVWIKLFKEYLPKRYQAEKAFIVDSNGKFSEQIDIVIFDRQYSPFIFTFEGQIFVPAESVYAVFEAKQVITAENIEYAKKKLKSVKKLKRTSLPIYTASGRIPAKPPMLIHGGILTLESDWRPAMSETLINALIKGEVDNALEIGCVAAHGYFKRERVQNKEGATGELKYILHTEGKHATGFLLDFIDLLQYSGTVPMIDLKAYARWIMD